MLTGVLVARLDNTGDVLLTGPLVRACAAGGGPVTFLASRRGAEAAHLLPGVGEVVEVEAPWIVDQPEPVTRRAVEDLVAGVAGRAISTAVIVTSFHQSPLPLALLLRLAGVERIGAISVDYPGSLLDVRHSVDEDLHEVQRSLSLGAAMGFRLPPGDDASLRVQARLGSPVDLPAPGYVVVHPGASVPARTWAKDRHAELVRLLGSLGVTAVVTGGSSERALTAEVAGRSGIDLGGCLDLAGLAAVIGAASAVVVGNTGPAHLAAAVGTPVVSLYAPTVPAQRWHPWMVRHVILGDQDIACAGCRTRQCPVTEHPCLGSVGPLDVVDALDRLGAIGNSSPAPELSRLGEPA